MVERARETEALHRLFDAMRVYDAVKSPQFLYIHVKAASFRRVAWS